MPDTCADIDSVLRVVQAAGWHRIGIDGVDAAGNASLAKELSESLSVPVLELEDYLFKNQGGFVAFIDYQALSAALSSIPEFILSGVCLREVLANSGATLDGHIYVKRMRDGLWADEDECVFPDGVEAAIEDRAMNSEMVSRNFDERSDYPSPDAEDSPPHLSEEIMRYHDAYQPHEMADLVYERPDHAV